jgi:hypothetical protein
LTLEQGPDHEVIQRGEGVASMVVTGARNLAEPVQLEHAITVERDSAPVT